MFWKYGIELGFESKKNKTNIFRDKKKQLDCRRKVLEEKCKNKDFVQFQDDKERWATEAVLPNCNFNFNIKIKSEAPQKKGIFAKIRGLFG